MMETVALDGGALIIIERDGSCLVYSLWVEDADHLFGEYRSIRGKLLARADTIEPDQPLGYGERIDFDLAANRDAERRILEALCDELDEDRGAFRSCGVIKCVGTKRPAPIHETAAERRRRKKRRR